MFATFIRTHLFPLSRPFGGPKSAATSICAVFHRTMHTVFTCKFSVRVPTKRNRFQSREWNFAFSTQHSQSTGDRLSLLGFSYVRTSVRKMICDFHIRKNNEKRVFAFVFSVFFSTLFPVSTMLSWTENNWIAVYVGSVTFSRATQPNRQLNNWNEITELKQTKKTQNKSRSRPDPDTKQ